MPLDLDAWLVAQAEANGRNWTEQVLFSLDAARFGDLATPSNGVSRRRRVYR